MTHLHATVQGGGLQNPQSKLDGVPAAHNAAAPSVSIIPLLPIF